MNLVAARFLERERAWCLSANQWCTRRAIRFYFRGVSRLGDGAIWYALMLTLAFGDGAYGREAAAHLALVGAVSAILYRQLKRWTRRPRPCADDRRIRAWIAPLDEFSFPSGHTLHAVGFSTVACAWYPALAWVLVPFTASVAASRVVLGVHYPSDVAAATAIGAGLGAAAIVAF